MTEGVKCVCAVDKSIIVAPSSDYGVQRLNKFLGRIALFQNSQGCITLASVGEVGQVDKEHPIIDETGSITYSPVMHQVFTVEPIEVENSVKVYITAPYTGYGIGGGSIVYLTKKQ